MQKGYETLEIYLNAIYTLALKFHTYFSRNFNHIP